MTPGQQDAKGVPERSDDVDAFLARLPDDMRAALEKLRVMIAAAAPGAIETIAYGVPAFKYRGRPLVSFGAARDHCSFYLQSTALVSAYREELAPFDTAGGTVRFPANKPLPRALVTKLVKARLAETEGSGKR